ncbi:unnamed protein product [Triticum turgidum subsp. durum]|uniref:Aldose 1-epimerase n=1 Tax=Triticum turgidum subsp. durum TaxID=4567 RepID=A0A9R1R9B8_TRITD|nr:unnamed protein product [Triticum turgidum subsp. durum]
MRHHVNFKFLFPLVIQTDNSAFGPLNGRVAQRMARGRFVLDGKVYHTYINDGRNSIHGGHRGFSKVIWTVKEYVAGDDSPYITLYYRSFDGEQGSFLSTIAAFASLPAIAHL